MKKMFFMAAVAALALSSCSSDDLVQAPEVNGAEDGAVSFGAYVGRDTRAYTASEIASLSELQDAASPGFGVFAYEQGKTSFSSFAASTSYPNFFYNQQVKYNASKWQYAPVKYYSNNEGAKHSFFAYAPYQDNDHLAPVFSLGKAPQIRYNALQNIDLLWAAPTLDKEKAAIDETVNFDFKHALAKVKFEVAPFFNSVHGTHTYGTPLTQGTKITVKSIRFVGNVPSQALLNLETGEWTIENTQEGECLVNVASVYWDATSADLPISAYKPVDAIKVIPANNLKVEIVYDVETVGNVGSAPANPSNAHKETNTVVSQESFDLAAGVFYDFKLDLGMTSVKFDVTSVAAWPTEQPINVDLPNNHDFHLVSYVAVPSAVAKTITEAAADPSDPSDGDIYYNTSSKKMFVATGTPAATWEVMTSGNYTADSKLYVVGEAGACSVYEKYSVGGVINVTGGVTNLLCITPRSDGKVQKTDGTWITPIADAYYTVGSFLYQYKGHTTYPTSSNRR